MKIGLISGEFSPMPGGVGDFTRILAESMQDQGHDVYVLSRVGSRHASLPICTVNRWGAGFLRRARRWARHCGLDVVNLQFQTAAFDMSPFVHFLPDTVGVPTITTFHDLRYPYLFPKAGPLRNWIVMRLARTSNGVIATNSEDDQRLQAQPQRQLIPIGSSIARRRLSAAQRVEIRRGLGVPDDFLLLGHFGFVRAIKGAHFLIEALARLRYSGRNLRLVFIGERSNSVDAGSDNGYLFELDERIRKHNLEDAVYWTGYLLDDEVSAWLSAVDVMVLPYLDGVSFRRSSLIAALHHGCAIITTEPEIAEPAFAHGQNLWLAPRRSAEAIESAILQMMSNPEQVSSLRAGAEQLSKTFDWNSITRGTVAFYQSFM